MPRVKTYAINLLVSGISFLVGILIIEGALRIVYDPIDFFKPKLVEDPILRHRLVPESGAHDAWGYRNRKVPTTAPIVAIGDSQTYGVAADSQDAWPKQLEDQIGTTVYNMSLGGYGPVQYSYLLENQALKLKPKVVIAGFYMGNDLYDAFYMVYKYDHWASLRDSAFEHSPQDTTMLRDVAPLIQPSLIKRWLADHSMLYNMVFVRSFLGDLVRKKRNAESVKNNHELTVLKDEKGNIVTTFTPVMRQFALNLKDPRIREGLRISLERFHRMDSICKLNNIDFRVLIIPTKETVYAKYLLRDSTQNNGIIRQLLDNERAVTTISKDFFQRYQIKYIEVTDALAAAVDNNIYPNTFDGHPNKNGYAVIAMRIASEHIANKVYLNDDLRNTH